MGQRTLKEKIFFAVLLVLLAGVLVSLYFTTPHEARILLATSLIAATIVGLVMSILLMILTLNLGLLPRPEPGNHWEKLLVSYWIKRFRSWEG